MNLHEIYWMFLSVSLVKQRWKIIIDRTFNLPLVVLLLLAVLLYDWPENKIDWYFKFFGEKID